MARLRFLGCLAAIILIATATFGPRIASGTSSAQDSGGQLTFNTPTPTGGGQAESDDDGDVADQVSFGADAWTGGFLRNDAVYYGRPWTSIYGARSDYPAANLVLTLADDPEEPIVLTFDGLDDEDPGNIQMAVLVNGLQIYRGESWFPSWDGVGNGENAEWSAVRIAIPPEILIAGDNIVTIRNLTDAANFSSPPYILLSVGTATSTEPGIFGEPDVPNVQIDVLGFSIENG